VKRELVDFLPRKNVLVDWESCWERELDRLRVLLGERGLGQQMGADERDKEILGLCDL